MGRRVRHLHSKVVRQPNDPNTDGIGEVGEVSEALVQGVLSCIGPSTQVSDPVDDIIGFAELRVTSPVGSIRALGDRIERPPAGNRRADCDGEQDRSNGDEREYKRFHRI